MGSNQSRPRRLRLENLENRRCLAASVGWDGVGLGSASLTYYIDDIPSRVNLTEAEVRAALETALDAWATVADITFTETDSPDEVDCIEFSFGYVDGDGESLAFAYYPDDVNAEPIAGDVTLDKDESWEVGNGLRGNAYDLTLVAVHEIGHALGLDHSYLADSVMVAGVDADQMFGGLGSSDEAAILTLYAPVPTLTITSLTLDATCVSEGETVTLAGTFVEGDSDGTYTVSVDWGDGTTDTMATVDKDDGTFETTHQYLDDNPSETDADDCVVTVTITNLVTGESDSANTLVNVENVRPTITSLSASQATAGSPTVLTGTISDPGEEDTFTLSIAWYDGSAQEIVTLPAGTTEFSVSHQFPSGSTSTTDASYTILVTVEDDDTGSRSAYTIATVVPAQATLSDLGSVDFCTLDSLALAGESSYFVFETAHDGTVTLEAIESEASEGVTIALYDENPLENDEVSPIAESSLVDGVQRIDQSTAAGQTYYVQLTGTDTAVSLQITNLVCLDDTTLTVFGTDSDDQFEASAADKSVAVNGVQYDFADTEIVAIQFSGGDGHDKVILQDSPGDDSLEAWATTAVLSTAADGESGLTIEVDQFEELYVYARYGGTDTASLYDSAGNDKFKADPEEQYAKMYGGAMYNRVKFFEVAKAYSSEGNDLARLFGTTGDDTFEGQKDVSRLSGSSYDVQAYGFGQVIAYASRGTDVATLVDSEMKDELQARQHKAQLFDTATNGEVYLIVARGFDSYRVEASSTTGSEEVGGADIAKLWGTSADDVLEAADDWLRLSVETDSLEVLYDIIGFETVKVRDTDGENDTAEVTESLAYDLVLGSGWDRSAAGE
ncbi:MAG: matrixin family metalloprotease [Planctomycetaceae bacterium]|nr:matrixin family metalloprotease [Planctomycetaceae bacterium]